LLLSIGASLHCSHAKQVKENIDERKNLITSKSHFAKWQPHNSTPRKQRVTKQQGNDRTAFGSDALDKECTTTQHCRDQMHKTRFAHWLQMHVSSFAG